MNEQVLHVLWFIPTMCASVHFCLLRVHFLQARRGCRARKTATADLFTQQSIPPNFRMLASALLLFFFLMISHFQTKPFKRDIILKQQSWKLRCAAENRRHFPFTAAYSHLENIPLDLLPLLYRTGSLFTNIRCPRWWSSRAPRDIQRKCATMMLWDVCVNHCYMLPY